MRRIEIGALGEIAEQAGAIEEPARTIVKLELRLDRCRRREPVAGGSARGFPRRFEPIDIVRLDDPDPPLLTGEIEQASPTETVRAFVADQLAEDPDRTTLLAMVEQLLAEEGLLGR